jgi:protocatechuate 3,4-dioxygenase beta subunit
MSLTRMPAATGVWIALALIAAVRAGACPGGATPALTEGPFYSRGSPERTVLREPSSAGRRLVITGIVYDDECRPVAGAWLDFWQADARGRYDNQGFALRGHQFTDAQGRYTLDTVVPGDYAGRTSHIHVKVRAPSGPVITTQLYLPGREHAARNSADAIFDERLLVTAGEDASGVRATFDFKLPAR